MTAGGPPAAQGGGDDGGARRRRGGRRAALAAPAAAFGWSLWALFFGAAGEPGMPHGFETIVLDKTVPAPSAGVPAVPKETVTS